MDRHAKSVLRKELARVEAEQKRLEAVITYLHQRLHDSEDEQPAPGSNGGATPQRQSSGRYAGMTAADAAIKILGERGQPMRTIEIFDVLTSNGGTIKTTDNLYRALIRNKALVRVRRGTWALSAWSQDRQDSLLPDSGDG